MLNRGLRELPSHCRYVAWLEPHVLLTNPRWVAQTVTALQTYALVQPFAFAVKLPCGQV